MSQLTNAKPRRRRERVPMRFKQIRRALRAVKAVQSKFPELADHFQPSIKSLQDDAIAQIIVAIESGGGWTIKDIMDWTRFSRRVVDAFLPALVAQGEVKKSKFLPRGKGRPPNKFQATPLAQKNKTVG